EAKMLHQFGRIVRQAHDVGLPAIAWVYPRGPEIHEEKTPDMTAYAARVGMELGADIVKVYNPGDLGALRWTGLAAGKAKVVISGGDHVEAAEYENQVKDIMRAGLAGVAVGRNMWQSDTPLEVAAALKSIIHERNF